MFFTAPALLLRFTLFCVGIYIDNLPETLYFLLECYRYFRKKFGLGNIFETPLAALAGLPAVSAIPFFFARKGVKLILFGIFLLGLLSSKITSFGLKPVIVML